MINQNMAEGKSVVESGVKELEDEITCAICQGHYTEPKVLSCCHYYCKKCLYQLTLREGIGKPFSCPECRKETTLPEGGLDGLPTAFFVNRMKEVYSKLERAYCKVDTMCEICLEDRAEAFCRQCTKFICAECIKSHQKMKTAFSGHVVSTLAELRDGGAENIVTEEFCYELCDAHEQPLTVYCYDCNALICRDCTMKDHLGHTYQFVKLAAPEIRQKLIQQLGPLRDTKVSLSGSVKGVQAIRSEVEDQGQFVAMRIETLFDELQAIINRNKQEVLVKAAAQVEQKAKNLSEQGKHLSAAFAAVQSVIDYTEHCVKHSADNDIMRMHVEIQKRITKEIQEQGERKDLEPVEKVDMGVEVACAETLTKLCQTAAQLTTLPVDTVLTEPPQSTEVGKLSQFILQVSANGKPTKQACMAKCSLRCLADDSIIDCKVEPVGNNRYIIQYTPTVRGRHKLTMTVNSQEVAGSPFPVFVHIHPTLLGKPIRTVDELYEPYDVAVDAAGNLFVIASKNITVISKSGKKLRTLDLSEFNITDPQGVAVDDAEDCLYVTEKNKIFKIQINPKLKLLVKVGTGNSNGRLTVLEEAVAVCERNSKKVVFYNKLLDQSEQTSSKFEYFRNLKDVSLDKDMNLYVTDYNAVHVFRENELLRSFSSPNMKGPIGVCVAGQFVYVTAYRSHCVSVFTTGGKHVTSFGHGAMKCPRGVCVDRDGFVHVCDNDNSRVLTF